MARVNDPALTPPDWSSRPTAGSGQGHSWVWCQFGRHWYEQRYTSIFEKRVQAEACATHWNAWQDLKRKRREGQLEEQAEDSARAKRAKNGKAPTWSYDDYAYYVFKSTVILPPHPSRYTELNGRPSITRVLPMADDECVHGYHPADGPHKRPTGCECSFDWLVGGSQQ